MSPKAWPSADDADLKLHVFLNIMDGPPWNREAF